MSAGMAETSPLLIGLCVLFTACEAQETPAALRVELPRVALSADPLKATLRITDAEGRTKIGDKEYDFSVSPGDLATVDRRGNVVCTRSGDGSVTAVVGGVKASAPLRCRLVAKIEAPSLGRVELAAGPFVPPVRVLGKGGKELSDVPLTLTSKSSQVLYPKDSQLVPKSVGSAVVVARAGQAFVEFGVDVVRKVSVEALPLDGNRKINFSLEAGKYELSVKLPAEKRLKAEWRGAPYCDYSATAKDHVSTCVLRTKGGVVFDNPAYLVRGDDAVSTEGVSLFEVP
jgi:hypothetical protein